MNVFPAKDLNHFTLVLLSLSGSVRTMVLHGDVGKRKAPRPEMFKLPSANATPCESDGRWNCLSVLILVCVYIISK